MRFSCNSDRMLRLRYARLFLINDDMDGVREAQKNYMQDPNLIQRQRQILNKIYADVTKLEQVLYLFLVGMEVSDDFLFNESEDRVTRNLFNFLKIKDMERGVHRRGLDCKKQLQAAKREVVYLKVFLSTICYEPFCVTSCLEF